MVTTLPLSMAALLFLFPALFGAFIGVRRRRLAVHHAALIGSVNTALTVLTTWSTGWYDPAHLPAQWPLVPWSTRVLPFLLASLPAAYLLGCTLFSGGRPNDQNPAPPMVPARPSL
jgi:hypothetical protein